MAINTAIKLTVGRHFQPKKNRERNVDKTIKLTKRGEISRRGVNCMRKLFDEMLGGKRKKERKKKKEKKEQQFVGSPIQSTICK